MIYQEKNGVCLLDKPVGISSRQTLVKACKNLELPNPSKVGYSGTLDPLASGLLIILSGVSRKLQDFFTQHSKEYIGTIFLGACSDTDDKEGPIHRNAVSRIPQKEEIFYALESFQGKILQKPPMYSAIKIDGRRSHKMARKGEIVELAPRQVQIFSLEILAYEYPLLTLKVHCSAGTYIRSLARDLGNILGCGGYLDSLRRISCGGFSIEKAFALEQLTPSCLIPLQKILEDYPKLVLDRSFWHKIRNKQPIAIQESPGDSPLLWIENQLVALGKVKNGFVRSETILVPGLDESTANLS